MICIRPIAPFVETTRTFPSLSTLMTARIQGAGIPKRWDASTINVEIVLAESLSTTCDAATCWAYVGPQQLLIASTATIAAAMRFGCRKCAIGPTSFGAGKEKDSAWSRGAKRAVGMR